MTAHKSAKKVAIAFAGLAAFSIGFLSTLRSAPAQERFDLKVRDGFFAGFAGDREALDKAMKACEQALAVNPKNAEALVWHGTGVYYLSGEAFRAGDSQKGMELFHKGVQEMDQAVALDPDNVGVLIPRGAVLLQSTLYIPDESTARPLIEKGVSDYQKTLELQSSYFDKKGTHPRGELLFGLADGYRRLGNEDKAKALFERISTELRGTSYQKRADVYLQTKTLTPDQVRCAGCHGGK